MANPYLLSSTFAPIPIDGNEDDYQFRERVRELSDYVLALKEDFELLEVGAAQNLFQQNIINIGGNYELIPAGGDGTGAGSAITAAEGNFTDSGLVDFGLIFSDPTFEISQYGSGAAYWKDFSGDAEGFDIANHFGLKYNWYMGVGDCKILMRAANSVDGYHYAEEELAAGNGGGFYWKNGVGRVICAQYNTPGGGGEFDVVHFANLLGSPDNFPTAIPVQNGEKFYLEAEVSVVGNLSGLQYDASFEINWERNVQGDGTGNLILTNDNRVINEPSVYTSLNGGPEPFPEDYTFEKISIEVEIPADWSYEASDAFKYVVESDAIGWFWPRINITWASLNTYEDGGISAYQNVQAVVQNFRVVKVTGDATGGLTEGTPTVKKSFRGYDAKDIYNWEPFLQTALDIDRTITSNWTFDAPILFTPQMEVPAHQRGLLFYDADTESLAYYNENPDVTMNLGLETWIRVRNMSGVTITNGQVVYVNGASGDNPHAVLAQSNSQVASEVIGVVTNEIPDQEMGYVTLVGKVRGVDTSAYTVGTKLYLSTAIAGGLTNVPPGAIDYPVFIGYVTRTHVTVGEILVRVDSNSFRMVHVENDVEVLGSINSAAITVAGNSVWHAGNFNPADYYTAALLDAGQLDNRYYTETETNNLLAGKSNVGHGHVISDVTGLQAGLDSKIDESREGIADGIATLDGNTKIPLNQIPDSIIGQVEYKGTWNASTDTPTLQAPSTVKGHYYVVSTAGTYAAITFQVGDWVISDGVVWDKVDNTDAVQSVAGRTGAVVIDWTDVNNKPLTFTPSTHTHAASDITSGTFANARISQGNVTQHQGSLAIGWSQLSEIPAFASRWASWAEVTDKPTEFNPSAHNHDDRYYTETETDTLLSGKASSTHDHSGTYEPVFTKNTAFNKNFGITAGTVAEGDHDHSGSFLTTNTNQVFSSKKILDTGNNGTFETNTGGLTRGLEVKANGTHDAMMSFHVAGDYAVHFGLDSSINDLAVGGWSKGANAYRIWHAGNFNPGDYLNGLVSTAPSNDWNLVTQAGFYFDGDANNELPGINITDNQYGFAIVKDANYQLQIGAGSGNNDPLGYRVKYAGNWDSWATLWSNKNLNRQGIGEGTAPGISSFNGATVSGFYNAEGTTSDAPGNLLNAKGPLLTASGDSVNKFQLAATAGEDLYYRSRYSGGWRNWGKLFTNENIVGSVFQSGGVPTTNSAIIERGSNANGEYIKWADGTMICTHQYSVTYRSATDMFYDWTLPAAFSNTSYAHIITPRGIASNPSARGNVDIYDRTISKSTTTCQAYYRWQGGSFSYGDTVPMASMAIGRWY